MFVPSPGGQISGWEEKPLMRIVIFEPMLIYRQGFKGEFEVLLLLKDSILEFGYILAATSRPLSRLFFIFNGKV